MALNTRKPILISGAGLASLLLAQSLRRANIPFVVFERDASISFRAQGYRLRLSSQGLDAIESTLGPQGFAKFWDACGKTGGGGAAVLDAITGEDISTQSKDEEAQGSKAQLQSRGGQTVGIARGAMRKLFLEGCEPNVRWAHHVTGYELTGSGVRAIFADGSKSEEGEMLVGGEGVSSKVAKQLSNGKLKVYDTGARGIHGTASTTAFKGLGEGVWRITDNTKPGASVSIITNVRSKDMDDPEVIFGWTLAATPGVIQPPNDDYTILGKPAADIAKNLTKDWNPRFKPLVDDMIESEAAFWKITCSTPTGVPDWPNDSRVTVVGDAAHSMTPASGNGANTAVRDAELLGRLLTEAGGYADGVTAAYEKEMRDYASEAVRGSYGMASKAFGGKIDENSPTV
ncbi:FAD/NAD(P)-binding domain-containing protein [Polyplosphaeria fusca]|uniref:FAD/NAD(P)-binding domain-containing protein n=1 Tax=Polyplosphaeria fusca TaxID=682080 RepID=A0A9P4R535_9PLEO|nr:FAD/NAD(P)-binding domain-containing protein [Polyplosphaeria fusca]